MFLLEMAFVFLVIELGLLAYNRRIPWRMFRLFRRTTRQGVGMALRHRDNARRFALAYEPFREVEAYVPRHPGVNALAEHNAFTLCLHYNLEWSDDWADINRQANAIREADMFLAFARRQVALRKRRRNEDED